jgi:hypothetical protein
MDAKIGGGAREWKQGSGRRRTERKELRMGR